MIKYKPDILNLFWTLIAFLNSNQETKSSMYYLSTSSLETVLYEHVSVVARAVNIYTGNHNAF